MYYNYNLKKSVSFRFSKCSKKSCKHCSFADSNTFIKLNNFTLPIQRNNSCEAKNLIYILYCNICFNYYIGQTKDFKKIFNKHKKKYKTLYLRWKNEYRKSSYNFTWSGGPRTRGLSREPGVCPANQGSVPRTNTNGLKLINHP
jgi:predicted GIY-YIG superfamily endonuclease